jgi:hypothetical protein
MCNALPQGSVAIQGVVGIGKSSLLSRGLLQMEGFNTDNSAKSVMAVGDKDVKTVDEAARLVLESLINVDEKHTKISFKLGSIFETESAEICRNFSQGRHLAVLKRVVESEFLNHLLGKNKFLLLGIDEADKCPIPLARLVRSICTHRLLSTNWRFRSRARCFRVRMRPSGASCMPSSISGSIHATPTSRSFKLEIIASATRWQRTTSPPNSAQTSSSAFAPLVSPDFPPEV